ncbi:hypothetical protein SASPL_132000 [Salvia splendens]|uniref:U-box domain-containing protein n=1 Tax=Salvia splendens TaxID=180675 RepID=A0A8X8ZL51_SALSN|nr:hypothetical protein SASPL_132000 [Salvia splendens]
MPAGLEPLDIGVQFLTISVARFPWSSCATLSPSALVNLRSLRIESWVATGNTTCPADSGMVRREPLVRSGADSDSEAACRAYTRSSLLSQASSGSGSFSVRLSALRRLRGLARESEKETDLLLLLSGEFTVHSSIDVRVNSAALIESIAAGLRSPDLRSQLSGAEGVFKGIVGLLNYPAAYPRAVKVGIKALFALCLVKQHRERAVAAGAAEALVDKLSEYEKCDAERALATVELLCRIPSGCAAFAAHALTAPLLVKTILKISDRATEYAAGALLSLCSASEQAKCEAVAAGVLTQLLLLVQSDCTERAKRKAQTLLKSLRDSWPHHDSIAKHG